MEKDPITQLDYDALERDNEQLTARILRLREGMHALVRRHKALRAAAQRFMIEWKSELQRCLIEGRPEMPKGWGLDEFLQLLVEEKEVPDDSKCIDPDGLSQHLEDIEDWVIEGGKAWIRLDATLALHRGHEAPADGEWVALDEATRIVRLYNAQVAAAEQAGHLVGSPVS